MHPRFIMAARLFATPAISCRLARFSISGLVRQVVSDIDIAGWFRRSTAQEDCSRRLARRQHSHFERSASSSESSPLNRAYALQTAKLRQVLYTTRHRKVPIRRRRYYDAFLASLVFIITAIFFTCETASTADVLPILGLRHKQQPTIGQRAGAKLVAPCRVTAMRRTLRRHRKTRRHLGALGFPASEHESLMRKYREEAREHLYASQNAIREGRCVGALSEMGLADLHLGMAQAHLESTSTERRSKKPFDEKLWRLDAEAVRTRTALYDACLSVPRRR